MVRSKGWEVLAGLYPIRSSNFRWYSQLNFSRNVAIVESLPNEDNRLSLAYTRVYDNENQSVWYQVGVGDRIGDMWGTGYLRNSNGDFVINGDGRFIVDNRLKKLGNYNPDFNIGFYNNLAYKKISLNFTIDWRQGGALISRTSGFGWAQLDN